MLCGSKSGFPNVCTPHWQAYTSNLFMPTFTKPHFPSLQRAYLGGTYLGNKAQIGSKGAGGLGWEKVSLCGTLPTSSDT